MTPESRYYTSQRLNLHYLVWGDESKPPLILVHGTRDHARSWDRVAEALVDRYCVYVPDLRGHGDSEWAIGGDYSIIDYALDIHALGEGTDTIGVVTVRIAPPLASGERGEGEYEGDRGDLAEDLKIVGLYFQEEAAHVSA